MLTVEPYMTVQICFSLDNIKYYYQKQFLEEKIYLAFWL